MDLEMIILSEVRQTNKYHMIQLICRIFKIDTNNLFTKQKQTTETENRNREQTTGFQWEEGRTKGKVEVWD